MLEILRNRPKEVSEKTILPYMTSFCYPSSQDVTNLYGFTEQTYRLLIGSSYGIFYRINSKKNIIIVGAIFGTSEMKVKF